MASDDERTELAVVGGGPGGYAAAFYAADRGMKVTLVDPEADPGGVCLYRGCIPSKALLHTAKLIGDARRARSHGIHFGEPRIDLPALRTWKSQVVGTLTRGLGQLARRRQIRHLRGVGQLIDAHRLAVRGEGPERVLTFDHAVLAPGSVPSSLPSLPLDQPTVWTSSEALDLESIPNRLLVVGGGYIGLEMASVYAALGSRVTVVEATPSLLPGVDPELVAPLAKAIQQTVERVYLETKAVRADFGRDSVRVVLEGPDVSEPEAVFDRVLVAVGRKPRTEGLGLNRTQVEVAPDGTIVVDEARRTREPSLWAIGDATGDPMLAHKASHEGRAAVRSILGERARFDPRAIPAVVYTDPEIAWCGATREGQSVRVGRFPWIASGRALTMGRRDGLTKVVADASTGRVLGVGIVGPGAGDLIAEGVLAVEMASTSTDLERCIHPHPTLSETIMEAAEAVFHRSTHFVGG